MAVKEHINDYSQLDFYSNEHNLQEKFITFESSNNKDSDIFQTLTPMVYSCGYIPFDEIPSTADWYGMQEVTVRASISNFEPIKNEGVFDCKKSAIQHSYTHHPAYYGKSSAFQIQKALLKRAATLRAKLSAWEDRIESTNPNIESAIKDSSYILELEKNWDDNGADPIDPQLFQSAAGFIREYSNYVMRNTSNGLIQEPQIIPLSNDSLDIDWRTEQARLLVNIRKEGDDVVAYYYGDRYNGVMAQKGTIKLSEFSEGLSAWMKYLI